MSDGVENWACPDLLSWPIGGKDPVTYECV